MADHLAAGRVRNAEIAIQEEVAQAPSGEFGIARFDVGKFVDDRVLIHRKASAVRVDAIATNACVQFFGSAGFRVHGFMAPCEYHASRAAPRRSRWPPPRKRRSRWTEHES